jgi:hypothetical protein
MDVKLCDRIQSAEVVRGGSVVLGVRSSQAGQATPLTH